MGASRPSRGFSTRGAVIGPKEQLRSESCAYLVSFLYPSRGSNHAPKVPHLGACLTHGASGDWIREKRPDNGGAAPCPQARLCRTSPQPKPEPLLKRPISTASRWWM